MRQVTVQGTVRRPVQEVYDFLLDSRNDEQWCPMASDYELVEGEPGVGALYRYQQARAPGQPSITAWLRTTVAEPTTRIEWDGDGRGLPYHSVVELVDLGDGRTRLLQTNRVRLPNPVAQLAWFTIANVVLRRQMAALARVLAA